MKNIVFVLFLLKMTGFVSAQNSSFVDDIKYINYVLINFCIDSQGRITKTEVNRELTDYNNEDIIQQIINQMNLQSIDDTTLFNKCHQEQFTFINQSLEFSKIEENDFHKLEKFRKGNFIYSAKKYEKTRIIRKKNKQIEKTENGTNKYEIVWLKPNLFTLKHRKVANKNFKHLIGKIIEVEIISIIDDQSYIYRSSLNGIEIYGIMEKK